MNVRMTVKARCVQPYFMHIDKLLFVCLFWSGRAMTPVTVVRSHTKTYSKKSASLPMYSKPEVSGLATSNVILLYVCEQCSSAYTTCCNGVHMVIWFWSSSGVKKGDRVAIYMPMIIEITVAMLACARIGAVHSIVVGLCISGEALKTLRFGNRWLREETLQCWENVFTCQSLLLQPKNPKFWHRRKVCSNRLIYEPPCPKDRAANFVCIL